MCLYISNIVFLLLYFIILTPKYSLFLFFLGKGKCWLVIGLVLVAGFRRCDCYILMGQVMIDDDSADNTRKVNQFEV